MTLPKIVGTAIGSAALAAVGYVVYGYATAETRVRTECAEIQVGSDLLSLRAFARSHGLSEPRGDADVVYLVESRTFGRYGCKITLKAGAVQTVQYDFAG
jgi:hypothetical protein